MNKIFNDRYEILEKIGTGGMADVYKATDKVLERSVALKVLHPQYASESSFIGRFRTEAKAAANLNHTNIVNIYDWGQQDDQYYIVMEYIKGRNLKEMLNEKDKLSWMDTAKIGMKVASALTFAHRNDVVHRDIKPHNIIIAGNDVKVTDFGIARAGASTMTQTGTILGTAHYISPEQAQGVQADARSDIYSLGIVLFETVTGKPPFNGENPIGIAMKHVSEPLPEMSEEIPLNLQNIIRKSLAKDPEERYQTAEELRHDLDKAISGEEVAAPMASEDKTIVIPPAKASAKQQKKALSPKKKRKKWPYFMMLVALIALAGALYAFMGNNADINVPDVRGMEVSRATKLLKQKKLGLKVIERRYSEEYEEGLIMHQEPEDGSKVQEGTVIKVIVSKGIEKVIVPNVTGQTRAEAESTLLGADLTMGKITYQESDMEAGTVLGQSPNAGEEVVKSSAINLVISKEVEKVTVPNVIGRSKSNAGTILGQAGLTVSYTEQYSDDIREGLVIDQTPEAGTEAKKGSTVVVYVSKGKNKVRVPDVVGMDKSSAIAQITAAGLTVKLSGAGDTVDQQSPVGGAMVKSGTRVTLTLIAGP